MKDAKGHGSDSRTTFGKRTQIPYPAHQSGIAKLGGLAKTFLKSESGGDQIHGGAAHYLGTTSWGPWRRWLSSALSCTG